MLEQKKNEQKWEYKIEIHADRKDWLWFPAKKKLTPEKGDF